MEQQSTQYDNLATRREYLETLPHAGWELEIQRQDIINLIAATRLPVEDFTYLKHATNTPGTADRVGIMTVAGQDRGSLSIYKNYDFASAQVRLGAIVHETSHLAD